MLLFPIMTWWSIVWIFYSLMALVSGVKRAISEIQQPSTSVLQRPFGGLSYPEDSEMGLFFALAIPLDDPKSTKAISVAFFFEANYQLTNNPEKEKEGDGDNKDEEKSRQETSMNHERGRIDRRAIYTIMESKFETLGFPGKACLLRSICETSRDPLHYHNGLLGDILRILFTPSASLDENLPDEYTNAENAIRSSDQCCTIYSLCPFNIYDYITASSSVE